MSKIALLILSIVVLFGPASTLEAVIKVVDFDDLTVGSEYDVGDTFESCGVTMTVKQFQWDGGTWYTGGSVPVGDDLLAGGYGNELEWVNNANVDFDFGGPVSNVAFKFMETGGNENIEINGEFHNINDFSEIDGFTIGGTTISLVGVPTFGTLYINGTVNSLSVGGQELNIDNVWYVPEPATICLLGLGVLMLRKRRP